MARKRKPEKNVFIARARAAEQAEFEQIARDRLAAENLPNVDDLPPMLASSKPSPARPPSASRAESMAARARQRKTRAFVDRKRQQRATRKEDHDE